MATATDIQVFGQLGLETADSNPESINEINHNLEEVTTVSVVPHYAVTREYPRTGETSQSFFTLSGIGILFILLLITLSRNGEQSE